MDSQFLKKICKKGIVFFGLLAVGLFVIASPVRAAVTWTETQPIGNVSTVWQTVASSSDGTHLIVGVGFSGRLYISSSSGSSWSETQPAGNVSKGWQTTASNADGTQLLAGVSSGRLYISSNSGSSWSETQPAGNANKNWTVSASSSDGTKLIAGAYNGRLYISSNSGSSWTETQPAGNVNKGWNLIASSADGSNLMAGVDGGRLYISSNSGSSWAETQPAGNTDQAWIAAASSSDGTKLIAGVYGGRLYISSNSGSSWTETQPAGNADFSWGSAASSSDGTHLIAGIQAGRLYVSANSGTSWTETQPAGSTDQFWTSAASSSDGSKLFVAAGSGRLYTGVNPLNAAPIFTSIFSTSVSVRPGSGVAFTTVASDPDIADTTQLFVCKANDFTGTACGSGGTWCSSLASSTNPTCNYTVLSSDSNGTHAYYASIIDNHNLQAINNPISQTFSTDNTPVSTFNGSGAAAYLIEVYQEQAARAQLSFNPTPLPQAPLIHYTFLRYLGYTDTGEDVLKLQQLLQSLNFFPIATKPNGIFGPITKQSVKRFQQAHGIRQTGNVGPLTLKALNSL